MQLKYFAAITCVALGYITSVQAAVDPVSLAIIVIAGVAIAKEKLIAAEIHRNYIRRPVEHDSGYGYKRGKRQAEDADSFGALYDSALELDTDDCAKLMVCHVFEKPVDQLNAFETKINQLFAHDLEKIDASSGKAEYQLAAFVGSLKQSGLCQQRYSRCLTSPLKLSNINL
jgi:hypothetical protein